MSILNLNLDVENIEIGAMTANKINCYIVGVDSYEIYDAISEKPSSFQQDFISNFDVDVVVGTFNAKDVLAQISYDDIKDFMESNGYSVAEC